MAEKKEKIRIDTLLANKGLAPSRERAQALIMAGKVFIGSNRINKAGTKIYADEEVTVKGQDHPYVSRGGLKIEKALDIFKIDPAGKTAIDIGSSTGGFTDCLLQRGADKVYAVDVGKGLIDYKLRINEKVILLENVNARYLQPEDIGETVDIVVADVAFISLTLIIPQIPPLLKDGGLFVPLVKPQFEVGKNEVEKGGIIRSREKHLTVLQKIKTAGILQGFLCTGVIPSPIEGGKGNREYLMRFDWKPDDSLKDINEQDLKTVSFE